MSPEEASWLRGHPTIKLGMDPHWPPFSFINSNGDFEGIDLDYLKMIGDCLGVTFETVDATDWQKTLDALARGEADLVSGISPTPERAQNLLFSDPYVRFPTAVICRLDGAFFTDLSHVQTARIACPKDYVTTEHVKKRYPRLTVIEAPTVLESLQLVSGGEADYAMENLATVSYLIRENGLTNLKIAGPGERDFSLHFGVRKDLPLLHSALAKALSTIDSRDRSRIMASWIHIERDPPPRIARYFKWIIGGLALALSGLLVIGLRNRRLRRELAERHRIEAELRQLNLEKSQFMSMAAHDINNPLTVISMNCQLALSKLEDTDDENHARYDEILKHAGHISRLIANLLNPGDIEQPAMLMRPEVTDIAAIVDRVITGYSHICRNKKITLTQFRPDQPAVVWADPNPVMQVFENLISNAVKFSPVGGTVELVTSVANNRVRVEVRDSGPGISDEEKPKLFGWFSKLSALPTGGESSHGLGLFIVKELMSDLGGKVWVESTPGMGASFFVEFPRLRDDLAQTRQPETT